MNKEDKKLIKFFRESFNEPVKPFEEWAKENNIVINDEPVKRNNPTKDRKWLMRVMSAVLLVVVVMSVLNVYGVFKKPDFTGNPGGTNNIFETPEEPVIPIIPETPKAYFSADINAINYDISELENYSADLFGVLQKLDANFDILDYGAVYCDYTNDKNELVSVVLMGCTLIVNDDCAYQVSIRIRTYKHYTFLSNEFYPQPSDNITYKILTDKFSKEKCYASYTAGDADYFFEFLSLFEDGYSEQNLTEFFSVLI